MVATDSEVMSQGEVQSSLQSSEQQQPKNNGGFPQLGRQSSIYSLTLDEFQHTLCESGKNFGSMNMDEFLNSIWTAEENQAHAQPQGQASSTNAPLSAAPTNNTNTNNNNNNNNRMHQFPHGEGHQNNSNNNNNTSSSADHHLKSLGKQPSLPRQGSLTLPPPLCRKTVEEVWAEIHKTQQEQQHTNSSSAQNPGSTQRQVTFGEMTLEDFLVRAGVVREQGHPPSIPLSQPQPYGMYQNNNNSPALAAAFMPRPVMPLSGPPSAGTVPGPGVNVPAAYQPFTQSASADASLAYPVSMKRGAVYASQPPIGYGGRVGNGNAAGYGQGVSLGSPVSPVSSDGMGPNQVDGNQYGMDIGGQMRVSRKRIIDGPIEKVVERRQRRMIKNRESAARSRARKQAYTVELEAELNQLKEENSHLKQALADMERKRKQQLCEEVRTKGNPRAQKFSDKLRVIRRTLSFP